MSAPRSWDVFCRVIDNHGDLGVAWRLCCELAARGGAVRLCVDDAGALGWMAPAGHPAIEVLHWSDPAPDLEPAEAVVETFGCELPTDFVRRMASRRPAPHWINLEYLSAEDYVERSHCLPSPITLPDGTTLQRRFFYPGFTQRTGGLLREAELAARREAFDRAAWLAAQRIAPLPGERLVSLFCYDNPALPALVGVLASTPSLILATPGPATQQLGALLGTDLRRGALRVLCLPWLTQPDYDRLLWSCDLNFVRGEDSFVRAQWAGRPFAWQVYPQHEGSHRAKLLAFLDRLLRGATEPLARPWRALMLGWNGFGPMPESLPDPTACEAHCRAWRGQLSAQTDLATQLIDLVSKTR